MATLVDLKKLHKDVHFIIALYGATADFKDEFDGRFIDLGATMLEELNLRPISDLTKVLSLPDTTKLPPKTKVAFEFLKAWLKKQHNAFND